MNNKTNALLAALLILTITNLGLTAWVAYRPQPAATTGAARDSGTTADAISDESANALAKRIVEQYNAREIDALYASFDELARMQLSKDKLVAQIDKLHEIIGPIDEFAFERSEFAGNDAGRDFYHLHYRVSLSGALFSTGSMKLTVMKRGDELGLFGFFVNGTDNMRLH